MKKNKTKRIITISPSSNQHKSTTQEKQIIQKKPRNTICLPVSNKPIKQVSRISKLNTDFNKSYTPIKPLESSKHTRTSTSLKTTSKSRPSENQTQSRPTGFSETIQFMTNKNSDYHQCSIIQSKQIQEYCDEEAQEQRMCPQFSTSFEKKQDFLGYSGQGILRNNNIDTILRKINQNTSKELCANNPSICLQKKMEIKKLRGLLNQGKQFISKSQTSYTNLGQDFMDTSDLSRVRFQKIGKIKEVIREQITMTFRTLRNILEKREIEMNEELEQKVFEFRQKQLNKMYRIGGLRNFIQKCEGDINKNYQQIVEELEIARFKDIIDAYSKRLTYYFNKAKQMYHIKFEVPKEFTKTLSQTLSSFKINISVHPGASDPMTQNQRIEGNWKNQILPQHQRFNSSHKNHLGNSNISINIKALDCHEIPPFLSSRNR